MTRYNGVKLSGPEFENASLFLCDHLISDTLWPFEMWMNYLLLAQIY